MNKVLPFGARVRLSNVDMNGYLGRDLHPEENDIGFLGVVVKNVVMRTHVGGQTDEVWENVEPGTPLVYIESDDEFGEGSVYDDVCYEVMGPDGRCLECMSHEIEVIGSPVFG